MPDSPDALSVVLRAVSFVFLLNAAGIAIFIAVFGRLVTDSLATVSYLGWWLTVGALVFVAGHHALEAARMAGEMSGLMDPAMQSMALRSPAGAAFALRMFGLALVMGGLHRSLRQPGTSHTATLARTPLVVAITGAFLAVGAFTLTGHTSVNPHHLVAAVLLTLHLLVVAFWLGSLWPLYIAATREQRTVVAQLIEAFSRIAGFVVPVIVLAGVGLTALLVPSLSVFRQPYGQLLLAKAGLFAVLMGLAAFNKWIFGPAVGEDDGATRAFRRTIAVEYVLICTVLAVTAAMTTFYSPEAP